MTYFTTAELPRLLRLHQERELPAMWIGVTLRTTYGRPVVLSRGRPELCRLLVAVFAGHRSVASGQRETRTLMLFSREGRRHIAFQVMALLARIQVWRALKLAGVAIRMTVGAAIEFQQELGRFALRNMALSALQPGMAALQRVSRRGMLFYSESRRLESLYRMALLASAIVAPGELTGVIVIVATCACRKWKRLSEIALDMALGTLNCRVLSE